MGRTKGVKNGEGNGIAKPQINRFVDAKSSFKKLREQGFLDDHHYLTEKGTKYVEAKLQELGMYNLLLLENFFLKGAVDYTGLYEEENV